MPYIHDGGQEAKRKQTPAWIAAIAAESSSLSQVRLYLLRAAPAFTEREAPSISSPDACLHAVPLAGGPC